MSTGEDASIAVTCSEMSSGSPAVAFMAATVVGSDGPGLGVVNTGSAAYSPGSPLVA